MLKNYLLVAFRNLLRFKVYSFINIAGLAVGIAACALILLYIQDELSYDGFHSRADRIYRIKEDIALNGVEEHSVRTPFPVATSIQTEFPGVQAVRMFRFDLPIPIRYGEKVFREERFFLADSTFFSLFEFPVLAGDPATALTLPRSMVITEAMSKKYFGSAPALGRVLRVGPAGQEQDYKVTAVIADVPYNSHMQFDVLASLTTLNEIFQNGIPNNQWWWNPCWTYLLLPEGMQAEQMDAQLPAFVQKFFPEDIRSNISLSLQPLRDIHLYSQRELEMQPNSNILYIYIFSAVALFILLIACINFMNLATARSARRAREVGMRKALGAHRMQIVRQFFGESLLISFLAVVLGVLMLLEVLPPFNAFTDKNITAAALLQPFFLLSLLGILLLVGLVAGSYPALYLSRFAPAGMLKSGGTDDRQRFFLRRALVVGQFAVSIIMLIGTGVVYRQMQYLEERLLGFDKEHIIMIDMNNQIGSRFRAFKEALLQKPGIHGVSGMTEKIGMGAQIRKFFVEGTANEPLALASLGVDIDFVPTMGLTVTRGRAFSSEFPTDTLEAVMINESAVRRLGWEQPVGKAIGIDQGNFVRKCRVVGVVQDFHYASLHQPVQPIVLFISGFPFAAIRVGDDVAAGIETIRATWKDFAPDDPFDYHFLDSDIDGLYRAEQKLGVIVGVFSVFAVFVACLGLFGLAAFTAEQRRKEIGVRKVLGASVGHIVMLLSFEFTRLVLIALLIAIPVGWLAMSSWLENFAYRTSVGADVILTAGVLALVVAWITVGWQSLRAAVSNPVRSIKYE